MLLQINCFSTMQQVVLGPTTYKCVWREAIVSNLWCAEWKKFKQDADYLESIKQHVGHLDGAENEDSFSGAAQPNDKVELVMLCFAGASSFTVNLNLKLITNHETAFLDTACHSISYYWMFGFRVQKYFS